MRTVTQILAYLLFAGIVGYFSAQPPLRLLDDDEAVLSLSFTHAGQRIGECKRLSQQELLSLPPNMRQPDKCPRERHPLYIEVIVDGTSVFRKLSPPSGLWNDGKTSIYHRSRIAAGDHIVAVRMNDSGSTSEFDFENTTNLTISAEQSIVIFFDPDTQRFVFE